MPTNAQALSDFQSGKITAAQYNQWAATGSYSAPAPAPAPVYAAPAPAPAVSAPAAPTSTLTPAQVSAGYSTIPGAYNPVTGQLNPVTPPAPPPITNPIPPATNQTQTEQIKAALAQLASMQSTLGVSSTPASTLTPEQISQGYSTIPGVYDPVTGQLKTTTPPVDNQAILDALGNAAGGTTGGTDYRQQMMDLINKLTTQNQSYISTLQNQPTAAQQYQTYREQLGLPSSEAALTSTNVQIQKTEGMIEQLEKDINARISGFGGKPITDPLRRRELAVEQKPLAEQLATLSRTAGVQQTGVQSARDQLVQMLGLSAQDQATQAAIAKAPLEMTQGLLPTLSSLLQYQSPEEETAQKVALEKLLKESGLGSYFETETTPSISEKYGSGVIGEYNFYVEQEQNAGRTPLDFNAYQTQDANRKAIANSAASGGMDWKTANYVTGIDNNFSSSPIVKQFNEVQNKYASVRGIIDSGVGGPGDLALVFDFMKALDPTSVVRESEYDSAAKSGNIFLGSLAKFNGYFKEKGGFLPDSVKEAFSKIIEVKFNAIKSQYTNLRDEKARLLTQSTGLQNAANYLTDYDFDISMGGESNNNDPLGIR